MGKNIQCCKSTKDHLGNKYESIAEMCRHWEIKVVTYQRRIRQGWDIGKALTTPIGKACTDHLGNKHKNFLEMCEYWHMGRECVKNRLALGWDLEKALTTKSAGIKNNSKQCKDHTGKTFSSIVAMCEHWGIKDGTYQRRIRVGWSVEEALTLKKVVTDFLGNEYKSTNEMCQKYGISTSFYSDRERDGLRQEVCLGVVPHIKRYPAFKPVSFAGINVLAYDYKGTDGKTYYRCNINGVDKAMNEEEIYNHFIESLVDKTIAL